MMKSRLIFFILLACFGLTGCGSRIADTDSHRPTISEKRLVTFNRQACYRYHVKIYMSPDIIINTTNDYAVGSILEFVEVPGKIPTDKRIYE